MLYKFVNLGCNVPISVDKPDTWFCVKVIEETAELLTFPNPTIAAVIPETVPVNVGLANGAFKFNAVCVAVLIGSPDGDVLATFPKPMDAAVTDPLVVSEDNVSTNDIPPYRKSILLTLP